MTTSSESPSWLDGDKIDEVLFCEELRKEHPMLCIHEVFFTVNGKVTDEGWIKNAIFEKLKPYVRRGLSRKIASLLDTLRACCYSLPLPIYHDRIHVANGTLFLDGRFEASKDFCLNRLPVRYDPEAPFPAKWLAFLNDLLIPEDFLTLQEFMGYCLIPSTKAQKMLMLVGKGGEGKSRVGIVLSALLGTNMYNGSIAKVETSPFARADLEYGLLLVDDDMKMEALPQTNNIKAIITAELPMDLERKRQQSYQGDLYVRFIGLGNGVLQALHDRSVGFFRRQIILTTKEKDPNRKDDPYIAEKMTAEAEGIFLWALEGLHRLIANDFRFTLSQSALDNLNDAVSDGNNIIDFLASEGYIRFRADYEASSKNLYAVYKQWCDDNALNSLSQKSFGSFLKQNESRYNLEYTNKVNIGGGRFARGFVGIELLQRPFL
jgi:putative DNA primase/helicase